MYTTTTSEADPRVAPAAQHLASVAARVHTVWERMGVSEVDRQRRWDTFLHTSLLPFIDDYGVLQASAEYNAATENDTLLRDVCYLATRLDEVPRHADVAAIVALLKRHYARTPMQSPLLASTTHAGQQHERQDEEAVADDDDVNVSAAPVERRSAKELMYLSLPSFAELLRESAGERTTGVMVKTEAEDACRMASTGNLNWVVSDDDEEEGEEHKREGGEGGSTSTTPPSSTSSAEAARALAHMMHANTHEGVRQQLQSELDRLKALADNRLGVLQLLYKQRAILGRSASEQVTLRAAYRAKYLADEEGGEEGDGDTSEVERVLRSSDAVGELDEWGLPRKTAGEGKQLPTPTTTPVMAVPSSPATNTAVTVVVPSAEPPGSPPASSRFLSLPASPKSSGDSTAAAAGAPRADAQVGTGTLQSAEQQVRPSSVVGGAATRCVRATTQAELQLLLSAASCTLDQPSMWDSAEQQQQQMEPCSRAQNDDEGSTVEYASGTSWPTCSSTTAVSSQQRSTHAATTAPNPSAPAEDRPTILEVDVSAITAYGTHQDLSLRRIQQEAESILAAIAEHNRTLQTATREELRAMETLEVLWRAMSTQKTSPKISAEEVGTPAGGDGPLSPPSPLPFAVSTEEVMARYAQLQEAFTADVAAQRRTIATSSNPTTVKSAFASSGSGEGGGGDGLYLPPIVRQVLRAPSFAPVFDYVHRARLGFQQHLSTQQDALVEKVMARLRAVYKAYYAATRDSAYAVAPDGELRVAMEEELLETLQASEATQHRSGSGPDGSGEGNDKRSAATAKPSLSGPVLLRFQRHLMACRHAREQAAEEVEYLQLRLHIIEQAEPLVTEYQEILREQAEMKATSRERLLSKKVNMAKQLLQEEKVRRRVAKDLPRIVAHLTELVAAWDALQADDLPCHDDHQDGDSHPSDTNSTAVNAPSSACVELCIHGQRVRDLLARAPPARTRPRSVSAHAAPSSRSISPVVPATSRTRTEARSSPSPALARSQPPIHRNRNEILTSNRGASRSPSFASSTATAMAKWAAPFSRSQAPRCVSTPPTSITHHGCSPAPPARSVPATSVAQSRVRSLSPALRRGLSARKANTPAASGKGPSQSPVPVRGVSAMHPVPLSTQFKSHH
jgi:hypothetical protein